MSAELKEKLTPEYIIKEVHGIVLGQSKCMECGAVLTDNNYSKCLDCDKPWPRICPMQGCLEYVRVDRHVNSKGGVSFYEIEGHCGCAALGDAKKERSAAEVRWRELYCDEPHVVAAVDDYYRDEPNRSYVESVLTSWYKGGERDGWSPLYIFGPSGSSKSTMVSRIVRTGMLRKTWHSVTMVRETTLKTQASKFAGNEDGYSKKWKRLHDTGLLILDGWDSARSLKAPVKDMMGNTRRIPGYTPTQLAGVASLLRHRLQHTHKPTIFISLLPPSIKEFGADVASRWGASNYVGETDPIDYRQRKSPMRGEYCD